MRPSISAATIISNAIRYDFPIVESINSVIDEVSEYIINLDTKCNDGTNQLIKFTFGGNPKVKIIENEWEGKEYGTIFLSSQTNKAFNECQSRWILYLQADEVVHERDTARMRKWIERAEIEGTIGITFKYNHFIKDPSHVRKNYLEGYDAYDKEIRLIKNTGELVSFGDGQGFTTLDAMLDPRGPQPFMHQKDRYIDSDMEIFHYGWLKDKKKFLDKKKYLDEFYQISEPGRNEEIKEDNGEYILDESSIKIYEGSHPKIMLKRLGL